MKKYAGLFGGLGIIFIIFGLFALVLLRGSSWTFMGIALGQIGLGFWGVVIFLVYYLKEALQAVVRSREALFGALGGVFILFILIMANVIAHSKWGERKWDMTANKLHTLSTDSVELIKTLPNTITVAAFLPPQNDQLERLKDLVEKYTYATEKLKLEVFDADKSPLALKEFNANNEEIVVRNDATKKSVKLSAISEQELTTAIKRVMAAEAKPVYVLQGHGEGDIEDDKTASGLYIAKLLMENEGLKVLPLNLASTPEIPKDAQIIIAWGAQRAIPQSEVSSLEKFLERGGKLMIGQDPIISPTRDRLSPSGFEPLIEKYGLKFQNAVVLEYQIQLLQGKVINAKLAVNEFGKHPIVSKMSKQSIAEFFVSQPVLQSPNFKDANTIKREVLVSTGDTAWAEEDIGSIFVAKKPKGANAKTSSIPIGQIAEFATSDKIKDPISKEGKLVVFGDADFANNQLIQSGFNRDLFVNSVEYFGGEVASLNIRPKMWTTSTLEITPDQMRLVSYTSIFVIPQFIIALGVIIWLMRRSRSVA